MITEKQSVIRIAFLGSHCVEVKSVGLSKSYEENEIGIDATTRVPVAHNVDKIFATLSVIKDIRFIDIS